MKEIAVVHAEKIKAEKPKFSVIHRKDGDTDFVSTLVSELASEVSVLYISNQFSTVVDLNLFSGCGPTRNGRRG